MPLKEIMKILKAIVEIIKYILIGILTLAILSNSYVMIMRKVRPGSQPAIFGYSVALVVSGSMEPAVCVDDIIIIKNQKSYKKNDIISFSNGKSLYTHRIVEITTEGFVTKGDANNAADDVLVKEAEVSGKVIYVIPRIGSIVYFLRSPLGIMLIILFIFGTLLMPDKINKKENDDETTAEI